MTYAGSTAERPLRVMPILRVSRGAGTIGVSLTPAAPLRGKAVYLFRVAGREWIQARSVRLAADGRAAFRGLAAGRYYVGFAGNAAYWATASEPFNVRR